MTLASIRARTTLMVTVVVAAVWLLATWLTWRQAEQEAAQLFDGHLAQAASMLIAQTAVNIEEPAELAELDDQMHAPLRHHYARKVAFQVWYQGRTLTVHSENAPNVRLGVAESGFSDNVIDNVQWRVFSDWNAAHDFLVQVGEREDVRIDMAQHLATGLLKPLLWALPLLALLIWIASSRAMQPLETLAGEIAHRSPDRLDALRGVPIPSEVEPLVNRLNDLLARVQAALQSEKRFTGDAAHELRTPIAALAAQAEVALAAQSDNERRQALETVVRAAHRLAHLVDQMLTLARADSMLPAQWPQVDLAAIVREATSELAPDAVDRGIDLSVDAPESVLIAGEATWLRVLVRNLLENALRHARHGGMVHADILETEHEVALEICDNGAGVSDADMQMLGERFWRGIAAGNGSGLGLSIVQRVAELHGTRTIYTDNGPGLRVRVPFRRRTAD